VTWLSLGKGRKGISLLAYLHLGQVGERDHYCFSVCLWGQFPDALKLNGEGVSYYVCFTIDRRRVEREEEED